MAFSGLKRVAPAGCATVLVCAITLAVMFRGSLAEWLGFSVRSPAKPSRLYPRTSQEAPSIHSAGPICGRIGWSGGGAGPPPAIAVTLDGTHTAITNGAGAYRFDNVKLAEQPALPQGDHVLAAAGQGVHTKIIRFTEEWLARNKGEGCRVFDISLGSPESIRTIDAAETRGTAVADDDGDGIDDFVEDWLAQRFAPVVYYGDKETNFPVSVDSWLAETHLAVADRGGRGVRRIVTGPLKQHQLLGHVLPMEGEAPEISSDGTRSRGKALSFFLEDVGREFRAGGAATPSDWVTYVHSYANQSGGITLQYWRAYTWNQARLLFFDLSHGGDWEGIAVHLDSSLNAEKVGYLEHNGIVYETADVQWEGTHPVVWCEEGGHSSYPDSRQLRSSTWIRQETWTGGRVIWWSGESRGGSGGLLNVGEKTKPRNHQVFVQYSGLWGSKKRLFITSGYWGPSFNETGAKCSDGTIAYQPALQHRAQAAICGRIFITAWCDAMDGNLLDLSRECYALSDSP